MKRIVSISLAAAAAAVALSACGAPSMTDSKTAPPMPSAASSAMPRTEAEKPAAATDGAYLDYDSYQAKKADYASHKVVYFFSATWCHECQDTDKALMAAGGVPAGLAVVKVDYDSKTDLRKTYGVTQQHTFVQVDERGNEITRWSGSKTGADIKAKTK
ncbi:MAG: thioredoxin family protein [Propionibacteriaceae bacterium]|nr:thioredoxin family protein [Propionibacteriaceae bacterium]